MESIRIGTNLTEEKIEEIICSNSFSSKLKISKETISNNEFLVFNIDKHRLEEVGQVISIAKLIQNIISRYYMLQIIRSKLLDLLIDYDNDDISYLSQEVYAVLLDDIHFNEEKKQITNEIVDYLLENNTLILDGYLRFRSKSFEELSDKIIDKVILDIQKENEYEDFIEMLQFYLDSQIPKVDTVNVVINNDEFTIVDKKGNPVENESIRAIIQEYEVEDISRADILVSSLIVLAPNRVIVHIKNDKEKELMQVLKRIFTNRLTFCYSCAICDINLLKADD